MAIDRFFSMSNSIAGPATSGETITPNDAADIGFGDRRLDLHFGQVARDLEQRRRVEACGDGLPEIDFARQPASDLG